jgi:amidase
MRLDEYAALDAIAIAELVANGEVSAEEVRDTACRAIESVDATLNAVVSGPYDDVSPEAGAALTGVPFVAKDTLQEAGRPWGFGTALLDGFVAPGDATLAQRFRAAGLQSVARSATPEFAFNMDTSPRVHGPTRNPWNPERSPGGSSGGSAALVAAGAVPLAHANDGGGSIRIPAAFCGLVGLKPSRGRVPLGPAVGEAVGGFAHEFAVTRTVRDAAALLDAVCGPSPGDRYYVARPQTPFAQAAAQSPAALRIAMHTESYDVVATEPGIVAAVEAVAETLGGLGHHVERDSPRVNAERMRQACDVIWSADLAGLALAFSTINGRAVGPDTVETASLACIQRGQQVSGLELAGAHAFVNHTSRRWGAFLDSYDVYLSPTAPIAPPRSGWPAQDDPRFTEAAAWGDEIFVHIPFTPIANMTGQPSISLPLGVDYDGMPIGVMLTAQNLREDLLLALAAQLEAALPWADRRPEVHVAVAAQVDATGAAAPPKST